MKRRNVLRGTALATLGLATGGCTLEGSRAAAGEGTDLGRIADLAARAVDGRLELPEVRAYLVMVPEADRDVLAEAYGPPIDVGIRQGWLLLSRKCMHLGCRAPWCASSQRYECPCHGAIYTRYGEQVGGPSDSGLVPFELNVDDGHLLAHGPLGLGVTEVPPMPATALPRLTVVTTGEPAGASCIGL